MAVATWVDVLRGDSLRPHERAGLAVLGLTSVAPLLAWLYDLGSFHAWFWAVAAPGMVTLFALGLFASARHPRGELHVLLRAALVAGLVGTVGYDLFRVPFLVLGGLQLFAPIDSYGLLLVDATTSSGMTDLAGWAYHFSNGVGFAVTYAALAGGRHWAWGIAWAAMLETATLVTPFAADYDLVGKYGIVAIAYAAHVPYGLALGLLLREPHRTFHSVSELGRRPGVVLTVATGSFLVLWLQPWVSGQATGASGSADVAIVNGRFVPQFVRVGANGCFVIENLDDEGHVLDQAVGSPLVLPKQSRLVCPDGGGVMRWPVTPEPYKGGFVIVDDQRRGDP
jgi:hypothetical protein